MRLASLCAASLLLATLACDASPEIRYETHHLEIATDFDAPVCQGTLDYLEDHLRFVQSTLDLRLPDDAKVRVYWLEDTLDEWCRPDATGCFYPGTRVVFSKGQSITHEMVHALLNAEAHTSLFIEEGLAELYSGAGSRHRRSGDQPPPIAELVWLTPEEYRARALDYSLAANFATWLHSEYGEVINQRLAKVVAEGGGPEELAYELERLNKADMHEIEQRYADLHRTNYSGLRDGEVPALEFGEAIDVELSCADPETFGPLPSGEAGMYQTFRLRVLEDNQLLDLRMYAGEDVRAELIHLNAERSRDNVIDLFMPRPLEGLERPELRGTEELELEIERGSYLLYVSTRSDEPQSLQIAANLRDRPSPFPQKPMPVPGEPE